MFYCEGSYSASGGGGGGGGGGTEMTFRRKGRVTRSQLCVTVLIVSLLLRGVRVID